MLVRTLLLATSRPLRRRIAETLLQAGTLVVEGSEPAALWTDLERGGFDLLVVAASDLPEPWAASVARVRGLPERTEVVAVVESGRPEDRARLHAAGAFAVLHSDLDSEGWRASLGTVLRRYDELGLSRLRASQEERSRLGGVVFQSAAMGRLLDLARRVAAAETTLLILGETGVGKEWLARRIHAEGPRQAAPFLPVNCAAIPEALMESELFGHEAGSFTGALRVRRGAFELAHGGTLFLDEIGDMAAQLQGKLLRALEERRIQRLGAERAIEVDVRIVAATNIDLRQAMEEDRFRRDLFYRLSVVSLHIPPLRERPEDIRPLAEAYLAHFRQRIGRPRLVGFREESLVALEGYDWPGNVRELVNAVERAVLLSAGEWIEPADLFEGPVVGPRRGPREAPAPSAVDVEQPLPAARRAVVEAFERAYLDRQLRRFGGRVADTARACGIETRTLYNKMRVYGLRKESYRGDPQRP